MWCWNPYNVNRIFMWKIMWKYSTNLWFLRILNLKWRKTGHRFPHVPNPMKIIKLYRIFLLFFFFSHMDLHVTFSHENTTTDATFNGHFWRAFILSSAGKKKKHSFLKNITKFSGSISILVAKVLYPHFLVQQKHT